MVMAAMSLIVSLVVLYIFICIHLVHHLIFIFENIIDDTF